MGDLATELPGLLALQLRARNLQGRGVALSQPHADAACRAVCECAALRGKTTDAVRAIAIGRKQPSDARDGRCTTAWTGVHTRQGLQRGVYHRCKGFSWTRVDNLPGGLLVYEDEA